MNNPSGKLQAGTAFEHSLSYRETEAGGGLGPASL
jgi:hypothetical protein